MFWIHSIKNFLQREAASGLILLGASLAAILCVNTSLAHFYHHFFQHAWSLHLGFISITHSLTFWINDALMPAFFLLVGLELKREFLNGTHSRLKQFFLPAMAALGGMVFPAFFYLFINLHSHTFPAGWAIPIATDIAFAIGVLSLLGSRIPLALKLFLLTLAIFDDIGAILIIAIFHSQPLAYNFLIAAAAIFILLGIINRLKIKNLVFYLSLGIGLWFCILQSGIHPTISGVLLALTIPLAYPAAISPLHKLETFLHPFVVFFIMPLFALANAGISFQGFTFSVFYHPIPLGIIIGLFLGKQCGVMLFSHLTVRLGWARLPAHTNWLQLYGVALLCGIGFTMSLFLGVLSFENQAELYLSYVRIGVVTGSLLSAIAGLSVLMLAYKKTYK